jgi:hypothetical protein
MMLCDISVVFNSFADASGLMNRKRSSESRQVLVSFQSTESLGQPRIRRRRSSAMPSQYFAIVSRCGRRSRCRLDVRLRGEARRIAVNIAKLPELLQKIAKISGEHVAQ